jgi:hypothetical protein
MTTKPPLKKILQGNLHTENESNQTMKGWEVSNHWEEQTSNQTVALIRLHTIKVLNNKNA